MSNWIFVVTKQRENDNWIPAREIFQTRMRDAFWGLGERTPNRSALNAGDRVVFYVGIPDPCFAGTAILETASYQLEEQEKQRFSHGRELFTADYGVRLTDIQVWDRSILAQDVIASLSFVENVQYWGSYFQGGIRGIGDEDFEILTTGRLRPEIAVRGDTRDIESASEFALESHLEEFLHTNWMNIPWGRPLSLYETPESNGRQFPAGIWSIDFLAVDEEARGFVVIELKRGQTSDSTVGQVLRYIEWVRENIAEADQQVDGVIVCHEMDEALRLAVRGQPNISVLMYSVDFKLESASLDRPG